MGQPESGLRKNVSRALPLSRTTTKAGGIRETPKALTCEHSRHSYRAVLRGSGSALVSLPPTTELNMDRVYSWCLCEGSWVRTD